jgi:hypothetical protein
MSNLLARTHIYDAWTNVALAEVHLAEGNDAGARAAIHDAEQYYVKAKSAVEREDLILDNLADLLSRLNQVRFLVSRRSTMHP